VSVTAELIPLRTQGSAATLSVEVSSEDLLRLQALARLTPAGAGDHAELLRSAFHRGVTESYRIAGMTASPSPSGSSAEVPVGASPERLRETSPREMRPLASHGLAFAAAALAAIVFIVGSYAGHWSWTGLMNNGQVWDWMQLLFLPVALGTFPLWLRFSGDMSPTRRKTLGAAVVIFVAFVLAGYLVPLRWTGFRGHTLWNWLTLIVLPVTITTATVWPTTGRRLRRVYRVAAEVLGGAWVVTLIGGYGLGWAWTGYPGNTLWDWVQLLLAPIAISRFVVPELIKLVAGKAAEDAQAQQGSSTPGAAPLRRVSQPGTAT
jgi:hypothetical protein